MKKFKKKKQLVKTPNFKLSTVYERTIKLCYFWLLPKMFLIGRTSWKHSYLARQSNDNCNLPKIAIIIIPNYPLTVLSLHLTRKLMMDRNMLEDQLSDQNMAVRSNVLHISRHLSTDDDDGFDIFLFVKKGEVLCVAGGSCQHDSSIS